MSWFFSILLAVFITSFAILGSESLPQGNFRARQREFDGNENGLPSTIQPPIYGDNSPVYGNYPVNRGFQPGLSFLPPPLMMLMTLRNAAIGGQLIGPDGVDMATVQRVIQAVVKVLQDVEQEKKGSGNDIGASARLRIRG